MTDPLRAPLKAILGPTNTGKTHFAIGRMLAHRSGVIGLPLRLLAREVYDRIVALRGPSVVALVTGEEYGRVRAMMNERGEQVKEVGPGFPVEVLGLSGVPTAGDEFNVVEDVDAAKEVAQHRAEKSRQKELGSTKRATLEDLFAKSKAGGQKELNVVIKADVQGSAEAVSQALQKLATRKVGVKVLNSAVGAITETPVVRDGEITTARLMGVTLACDHRILYGADGAEFLGRVRTLLEEPLGLAL